MVDWAANKFGGAAGDQRQQPGKAAAPQGAGGAARPEAGVADGAASADDDALAVARTAAQAVASGAGDPRLASAAATATARHLRAADPGTAARGGAQSDKGGDEGVAMRRHAAAVSAAIRRFAAARLARGDGGAAGSDSDSDGDGGASASGPRRSILGAGGSGFNASAFPTLYVFNGHLVG
jgi:hypothetical protein